MPGKPSTGGSSSRTTPGPGSSSYQQRSTAPRRPRLTDGRILLRPRTEDDVDAQMAGEDREIIRWLTGGPPTEARVGEHITNLARSMQSGGLRRDFGIYLDHGRGAGEELIGTVDCNFADLDLELNEVNLSYAVFGPWRRHGVATAALTWCWVTWPTWTGRTRNRSPPSRSTTGTPRRWRRPPAWDLCRSGPSKPPTAH